MLSFHQYVRIYYYLTHLPKMSKVTMEIMHFFQSSTQSQCQQTFCTINTLKCTVVIKGYDYVS